MIGKVCKHKATDKLIEFQSGKPDGAVMIQNAVTAGYLRDDVEVVEVTAAELQTLDEQDPVYQAQQAKAQARSQAIADNLPSWAVVSGRIDDIATLDDAKNYIRKLSRVVYWLAKNEEG